MPNNSTGIAAVNSPVLNFQRVPLGTLADITAITHHRPKLCHRCSGRASKKGRVSASVIVRGRPRRLYICAKCCCDLKFQTRAAA
jgi:hypothetical protein